MSSLCLDCGLCCDGTLFEATALMPNEDGRRLAERQAVFVTEKGTRRFQQPCPAHECGSCTIYDERPEVCRDFRCSLLTAVDSGATDETTARVVIGRAMALRTVARPGLAALLQASRPNPTATLGGHLGLVTPTPPTVLVAATFVGLYNAVASLIDQQQDPAGFREEHSEVLGAAEELRELIGTAFFAGEDG
jgi:hypothetical protein